MTVDSAMQFVRPAIASLVVAALAPAVCDATIVGPAGRPMAQRQVRAPAVVRPWRAVRPGPHVFSGTIVAMHGTLLTLRLRNGRVQSVDATAASAHGDTSEPLFVGKLVIVDGTATAGTFAATHVFRLNNLADIAADH